MTPIFGRGIVFDAPPVVKDQQLRFVAHALKGSALKTYTDKIVKDTEEFLAEWGKEGEKDLLLVSLRSQMVVIIIISSNIMVAGWPPSPSVHPSQSWCLSLGTGCL